MLTSKYHIGSMIAIFLALGLGILIGGTLGQSWLKQTEDDVISMLLAKYEKQVTRNQDIQARLLLFQEMSKQWMINLAGKKIVWIHQEGQAQPMLDHLLETVGAQWEERITQSEMTVSTVDQDDAMIQGDADLVILTPDDKPVEGQPATLPSKWIHLPLQSLPGENAAEVARFMLFLSKMMEEGDSVGCTEAEIVHHYPRME